MLCLCPKRSSRKAAIGRLADRPGESICPQCPSSMRAAEKLGGLPTDLAVSLVSLGIVGIAIPGPIPPGLSFVLLGAVILWPGLLARTGGPLARRCPRVFRMLIGFTDHLTADLARRYPSSKRT